MIFNFQIVFSNYYNIISKVISNIKSNIIMTLNSVN